METCMLGDSGAMLKTTCLKVHVLSLGNSNPFTEKLSLSGQPGDMSTRHFFFFLVAYLLERAQASV